MTGFGTAVLEAMEFGFIPMRNDGVVMLRPLLVFVSGGDAGKLRVEGAR
jgi:hypothetical protein